MAAAGDWEAIAAKQDKFHAQVRDDREKNDRGDGLGELDCFR
jgi:hypothetical protein